MTKPCPQISFRKVSRRYGAHGQWFALKEATLDIERGDFVAIVGPSGSGKSTLMNVLGLLDNAWDGILRIDGANVADLEPVQRDQLRAKMFGFVFQSSYANPYESTARNAALGLSIQGVSLRGQSNAVVQALETVGLAKKANELARNLSGGERQRLALARALVMNPQVILADEPTGNLDSASSIRVMELLKELNQSGTTVVVVTHDLGVANYANRIIEVNDGRVTEKFGTGKAIVPGEEARYFLSAHVSPVSEDPRSPRKTIKLWLERGIRAINNVASRPMRSATLIAAFTIALAGMVMAAGIGASASQQISDRLATAALDEVRVEFGASISPTERQARTEAIRSLPHVIGAGEYAALDADTAQVSRFGPHQKQAESFDGTAIATNEEALSLFEVSTTPMQAAVSFAPENTENVALVGKDVAKSLGLVLGGFGAEVWVSGKPYSVIGTITASNRAPNLLTSVVVPISTLSNPSSQLVVRTSAGFSTGVAEAIPLELSPAAPAEIAISTTGDLRNLRIGVAQDLNGLLSSISIALLALAVLSASSAMFLSVQTRIQELALSRALGLSQNGVAAVFIWEGIIVGFAGSLAGLSLGLAVSVTVSAANGWSAVMPWNALALAPIVGIVSGAFSALIPALRAARIDPAEAIR